MTQIQRKTQAERKQLSDSRMLEAAVKLIVARGTEKTTLKEVGEMAGYSRGLAGYRFGSKAGLFEFASRYIGEKWLKELKHATDGLAGIEAIEAALDSHYHFCIKEPEQMRVFYILWFESIGPQSEVGSVIAHIHDRRHLDVARWVNLAIEQDSISPCLDADAIGGQFATSIVGIVYQWLVTPNDLVRIKALYDNLKYGMRLLLNMKPQEKTNFVSQQAEKYVHSGGG